MALRLEARLWDLLLARWEIIYRSLEEWETRWERRVQIIL
jgi:hypothetical protein